MVNRHVCEKASSFVEDVHVFMEKLGEWRGGTIKENVQTILVVVLAEKYIYIYMYTYTHTNLNFLTHYSCKSHCAQEEQEVAGNYKRKYKNIC